MDLKGKIREISAKFSWGPRKASPLGGKDMLHAIRDTALLRRKVFADKVFVPDHFTVYLSERDYASLRFIREIISMELTEELKEHFSRKGYHMNASASRIDLKPRPTLRPGQIAVKGCFTGVSFDGTRVNRKAFPSV